MMRKFNYFASTAAIGLALVASQASGQEAGEATNTETPAVGIEDIVVTAQRRNENLQNVPIAITAVSSEQLENAKIESSYDLVTVVPALTINRSAIYAVPFLRGVGTTNIIVGDEPSVASYVDGFYQGPSAAANLPFNNIERVEVLKGPQGTLYGRNATGGLINLITTAPRDSFAARGSIGYGNFDTVEADAYVTGPLSSAVRADLAMRFRDQGKGYVRNRFNNNRIGEDDGFALRGKIAIDLSETATLVIGADYNNARNNQGTAQSIQPGTAPVGAINGAQFSTVPRETFMNFDPIGSVKSWGVNSTLRAELGEVTLVSMTQYRHYDSDNDLDADASSADNLPAQIYPGAGRQNPAFYFHSPTDMPYFFTQELQLLSNGDGPFSWIVGGFGQISEERYKPLAFRIAADPATPTFVSIFADARTRALSTFGQLSYELGGGVKLTAGGRMTWEKKAVDARQYVGPFNPATSIPAVVQDTSKSWSAFTYRLAADWQANDDLLLYASASKGFKSGTYNTGAISATATPVNPETLYAYEVGFKSDPSTTLRVNGSVFYYDYKNIQFFAQLGNTSALLNAGAAELYGAELEAIWRPFVGFSINAAATYEHSEYTNFPSALVYLPFLAGPNGQPNFAAPMAGGQSTYFLDAAGKPVVRTPKFTGNLTATYEADFGNRTGLTLSANGYHNSGYNFDPLGIVKQKSYSLLGASATYRFADDRYSVSVWGRNLTNETYLESVTSGNRNSRVGYNAPRTYGVTFRAEFE